MLLCLSLLAGCAVSSPPVPQAVGADQSAPAQVLDGVWGGRFSLRVHRVPNGETGDGHQDSAQGGFSLMSAGNDITLDLNSPLGQTIAVVRSTPAQASLSLSDGRQMQAGSVQDLLEGQLGWRLPVDRLPLALSALSREASVEVRAQQIAKALGADWTAQLVELGEARYRLVLQWDGLSHSVSKLVLTLIIDPQVGVSTNLRR